MAVNGRSLLPRLLPVAACFLAVACGNRASKPPPPVVTAASSAPAPVKVVVAADPLVEPANAGLGAEIAIADVDHRAVALVADVDDNALVLVDVERQTQIQRAALDGAPGQLAVARDGTIYVAVRGASHVVALRMHADHSLHEVARRATGNEPYGLALSSNDDTLYVTSIADARVESFATRDHFRSIGMVDLPRDPRSAIIKDDHLYIAHSTGSVISVVNADLSTRPLPNRLSLEGVERRQDFGMERVTKPMPEPFGKEKRRSRPPPVVKFTMTRQSTQSFALSSVGDELFVPETLVLPGSGRISTGYGTMDQTSLSTHVPYVARIKDNQLANKAFSGPSDRSCFEGKLQCLVPRGVAEDGKKVWVACLDSNVVMPFDPSKDIEHSDAGCMKARHDAASSAIKVEAPTAVAIDKRTQSMVAFSSQLRKLTFVTKLDQQAVAGVVEHASLDLKSGKSSDVAVARGRTLFHSSNNKLISKNGRACASCHVDGKDDALVWPTPKGKRQTPMLAGRIEGTAPYDWNGAHKTLPEHIENTIKNLEGEGLPKADIEALAAYVASMRSPSSSAPSAPLALNEHAQRGKTIFESDQAECSSCHVEKQAFTDGLTHSFGVAGKGNTTDPSFASLGHFDTPSLKFVGQTAPYFHDGRFANLDDLVEKCDGVMGSTKHLSKNEKEDLVAYLQSL